MSEPSLTRTTGLDTPESSSHSGMDVDDIDHIQANFQWLQQELARLSTLADRTLTDGDFTANGRAAQIKYLMEVSRGLVGATKVVLDTQDSVIDADPGREGLGAAGSLTGKTEDSRG